MWLEFRLHYHLSKFDWSVFLNLKPISYFFGIYTAWFFIYWSSLDHVLMASIWEKAILILARNLNSGRSYLITAVLPRQFAFDSKKHYSKLEVNYTQSSFPFIQYFKLEQHAYYKIVLNCLQKGNFAINTYWSGRYKEISRNSYF